MLHKPNFCCECGEKIEKENRKWWDSRKFCDDCANHFDKLPKRIFKYFLAAIVFTGFGFLLSSSISQRKPPVISTQNQIASPSPMITANRQVAQTNQVTNTPPSAKTVNQTVQQNPPQTLVSSLPQSAPDIADRTETAYFCGARTQKGTPCSRRMRGGGRCWQHVGKPAMLPAEKLKITQ